MHAPADPDPLLGQVIGHFRVLAPLGRGGMGVVYRAVDVDLWREVALKLLPPHWAEDGERRALFLAEARSAAAVAHANIATIYEVGTAGVSSFIAMELVKGATLREALGRGLDHARALRIAIGIARGLARAHELGVIHRDLKPENVMLDREDEAKILDFGLARVLGERAPERPRETLAPGELAVGVGSEPTTAGHIAGTLGYLSPEQARGEALDARSDVFALGIVVFELFTGRRPFTGGSPAETLIAVIRDEPPSLSELGGPPAVAAIVER
jgi:serine/threonine protein kinase